MSNNKSARPWDLLNSNIGKVSSEIREKRLNICKECIHYINATTQCKKCGCIMPLKTKLPNAECPIGKWKQEIKEEV